VFQAFRILGIINMRRPTFRYTSMIYIGTYLLVFHQNHWSYERDVLIKIKIPEEMRFFRDFYYIHVERRMDRYIIRRFSTMQTHLQLLTFLLSSNLITRILLFKRIKQFLIPQVLLVSHVLEYHYCSPTKGYFVCISIWQHCSTAVCVVMAAAIDV
jgi:hypothetical protein